jgi:hypothetical protein
MAVILPREVVSDLNDYRSARGTEIGKIPSQAAALAELVRHALKEWRERR